MRYTVVVDNLCTKQGLYAEWGYAAYLEAGDARILLDTAGILHVLGHNMRFLGINPAGVTDIVLSHGHFDHTSGIFDMLREAPKARLWAGADVCREKRGDADYQRLAAGGPLMAGLKFTPVDPYTEIAPGVTAFTVPQNARDAEFVTTKNLWCVDDCGCVVPDTFADDLSMLVRGEKGYSLLLGCAHAGLPNIMRYVRDTFGVNEFDTVVGGTHLCAMSPERYGVWMGALSEFTVKHWRPNHCTGFAAAAALSRMFDDVDWAGAGRVLEL